MHNLWTWTKEGIAGGKGDIGWRGAKGENWDNCNSIINKIYLKKEGQRNKMESQLTLLKPKRQNLQQIIEIQWMLSYLYVKENETLNHFWWGHVPQLVLQWLATEPFGLPFSVSLMTNISEMVGHVLKDSLWVQTNRKITEPSGSQINFLSLINSTCWAMMPHHKENHIKGFPLS